MISQHRIQTPVRSSVLFHSTFCFTSTGSWPQLRKACRRLTPFRLLLDSLIVRVLLLVHSLGLVLYLVKSGESFRFEVIKVAELSLYFVHFLVHTLDDENLVIVLNSSTLILGNEKHRVCISSSLFPEEGVVAHTPGKSLHTVLGLLRHHAHKYVVHNCNDKIHHDDEVQNAEENEQNVSVDVVLVRFYGIKCTKSNVVGHLEGSQPLPNPVLGLACAIVVKIYYR